MSLMRQFLYRENVWLGLWGTLVYMLVQILFIKYLFGAGRVDYIGGYDIYQFYLMLAFGQVIITFVFWFVIESSYKATMQIYKGKLDYFFLRPMNIRFLMMHQEISGIQSLMTVAYLVIIFYYLFSRYDFGLTGWDWFLIVILLLVSMFVHLILHWLGVLINFYWPNFWGVWQFMGSISDISRNPKQVYPPFWQTILTYVIPIFLINNPIYYILDHSFSWEFGAQIGLIVVILLMIFMILWKDGLKRYSSAA